MPEMDAFPRLVVCAGLRRSASTWAYNAALAIMRCHCREGVVGLYANGLNATVEAALKGNRSVVVKTHCPDASLRLSASLFDAPVIVSIRDPLDCVASAMTQFKDDFDKALVSAAMSGRDLEKLARSSECLVIRYEADSTRDIATLKKIADALRLDVGAAELASISESLAPERVKALLETPEVRAQFNLDLPPSEQRLGETHWHPNHVGDGAVGKAASVLTTEEMAVARYLLRRPRTFFGYEI